MRQLVLYAVVAAAFFLLGWNGQMVVQARTVIPLPAPVFPNAPVSPELQPLPGMLSKINLQLFGLDAASRKFEQRLNQQDNRIKWLEERLNHLGAPG